MSNQNPATSLPDSKGWLGGLLRNRLVLVGGSLLALSVPVIAADKHPLTPQDLWAMQRLGAPALSPDGKTVVYGAVGHLWKKRLPDGKPERLTSDTDFAYDPVFSPDGRQLLHVKPQRRQLLLQRGVHRGCLLVAHRS
jgi:hypothetical protein